MNMFGNDIHCTSIIFIALNACEVIHYVVKDGASVSCGMFFYMDTVHCLLEVGHN